MSVFNERKRLAKVYNLAGGHAFKESEKVKLASILLSTINVDEKFYQGFEDIETSLYDSIRQCDKKFAAKAIIYARTVFGLRTISHMAASMLAQFISGEEWSKDFFDKVIKRPDDMTEIVAYHKAKGNKLSNSMKKGFAKAFRRFDEYQLSKYKGSSHKIKLVDVVNMVHPKESSKNDGAIGKLVNNTLKCKDTWESMLAESGGDMDKKKESWKKLIENNKIGYMALLKNLRNIYELGDENLFKKCLETIVDEDRIKKSMVLPFRFYKAYKECVFNPQTELALSRACNISCSNVPKFDGETLVALDVSGSMTYIHDIASLFTAVLLKANMCDFMTFSNTASYKSYNPEDSVFSIKKSFDFFGGWTNFPDVFIEANKKYDRIILLSDMQSWSTESMANPRNAFISYKKRFNNPDCKLYSFDLQGYGTLELPEKDVYCLAGFSDKVFDIMSLCEKDPNALINSIENSINI